ncbi:transposase [Thermohalobacter berrensis]|uniref:Transposase IS200-like domain-containing protein n=1 Tax=Thermohalobacter berrensis TaxID=99594 RepID=A0A419T7Y7_9FIRM|nr:transposase [Thermohalobacter berrensis]RKD33498.1 hypothetical protein BET03_08920 [Thermohalobacter berrensis]
MPRRPRKRSSTGIYHVMERGNQKKNIFHDYEDRQMFIDILKIKKIKLKFTLYAYCLMNNHIHLLINENSEDISYIMKSINVSYVKYYNKKYKRCGHLFQGRFKSECVDNESYLLSVLRYIHQNPVDARIALKCIDYDWSSYKEYIYPNKKSYSLIDRNFILKQFSTDPYKAVDYFRDFHDQSSNNPHLDITENKNLFIQSLKDAEEFLENYCNENNVTLKWLKEQGKRGNRLLYNAILFLKNNSCLTYEEISKIVGVSISTVSRVK